MTDRPNYLSPTALAERRIAAAQAAMTPVDSQGRPTKARATYTYGDDGLLVSTTPAQPDDAA